MAASLSAIVAALTRETMRKVAISTFICVHLLALAWWNFGVIDYRPDGWTQLRAGVDAVDRGGRIRAGLETYMRATGLWQRWVMFGPDVPHQTARVEVHGITGFDAQGRPILDPELLYTSDDAPIMRPEELSRELSAAQRVASEISQRQRSQNRMAQLTLILVIACVTAAAVLFAFAALR